MRIAREARLLMHVEWCLCGGGGGGERAMVVGGEYGNKEKGGCERQRECMGVHGSTCRSASVRAGVREGGVGGVRAGGGEGVREGVGVRVDTELREGVGRCACRSVCKGG
jgi:hypothetical protein